ncbi:phosphatase iiic [Hirsutella rhossiliensis]|uniref:Phosphatase iiic n=1 Tax=Hirsutella rhossiliensis TaxID=111463 RepID=A0A9P8MYJ4_9HYPO|nr:phosphatase iiic [Hirsutella rhossiliensis]KAH0963337.1 phosphatase iiic [Hirsutella rhossiliensis]
MKRESEVGDGSAANREQLLNVIIPIGGVGSRFAKHGYRYPKPLINIVGRPMLLWLLDSLSLKTGDTVWIAINEDIDDEFHVGQLTKGASETLYIVSQSMTKEHLHRKTVSLDCDTIYWTDILAKVRETGPGHGACFYFPDDGDKPVFSYLKTEPSAQELKSRAAEVLDIKHSVGQDIGEYYISQLISHMIEIGVPFTAVAVSRQDISCVGTPKQLHDFLRTVKSGKCSVPIARQTRRFCFDLDMTLVGVPTVPGDYSTCPPIPRNIRLVQELFKAGHHIIIQTARRMRTHHGNVGSVIADVGPVTFAQLAQYGIPFHEINFGKPFAHVYVDDLAVNSNLDTMREVGWLLDDPESLAMVEPEAAEDQRLKKTMIAARDFNTIQVVDEKVIKSSKSDNIIGEVYFYSHMPPEVVHHFPSIYNVDFLPDTGTYTITMESRRGLTFSHLLVGRSITKGRLGSFLRALHSIHSRPRTDQPSLPITAALQEKLTSQHAVSASQPLNIYANYGSKLRSRYVRYRERYDALGLLAASIFSRLNDFLDVYEAEERGVYTQIIHGDPVFSNAILSNDEQTVSFIDVRCQLGSKLTSEGDVNYDLAKVLQSLCGYDHVIFLSEDARQLAQLLAEDKPLLSEADVDLLGDLQEYYFAFLKNNYSACAPRKTLFGITASLLFSLIPLHRLELGHVFLKLCEETLRKAEAISSW